MGKTQLCTNSEGWKRERYSNAALLDRILHDQSSASGMHSQALDTMRHKLAEMEGTLAREQEAHKHYQVCHGVQTDFVLALALLHKLAEVAGTVS